MILECSFDFRYETAEDHISYEKKDFDKGFDELYKDNESDFITRCQMCGADDYLRYKTPEIDKTAVKADLQKGYKIEGASLVRKQSIIIK